MLTLHSRNEINFSFPILIECVAATLTGSSFFVAKKPPRHEVAIIGSMLSNLCVTSSAFSPTNSRNLFTLS